MKQDKIVISVNIALVAGHAVCLARLIIGFMLDSMIESRNGSLRAFLKAMEIMFQILSLPLFMAFDLLSLKGWTFADQFKDVWHILCDFSSAFLKSCREYN